MKKIIVTGVFMIFSALCLFGCKNTEENKDSSAYPICEIVESEDPICEKPMKKGIYTSKYEWDKAVKETDVAVVIDRRDTYDEAFFAEKDLVYIADCSSGNSQCEYEGFEIEEVDGNMILTVKISYSTDKLLNKLHGYHVFLCLDKGMADKVDDIKLEVSARD